MHFAEVQRGVVVHELLAVDEGHGLRAVHHGQGVQFGAFVEHRGHRVIGRGGGDGRGLHHAQAAQDAGARGLPQVRQHGHPAVVQHIQGRALDGFTRHGCGPPQQPALAVGNVQVPQGAQVVLRFNAFGNQRGAKHIGNAFDGLQHLQVFGAVADLADEVLVDLHEIGLHFGPQAQAGAAIAKVVQRHAGAAGVHRVNGFAQQRHVGHALVLGNFQHQHPRVEAAAAHRFAQLGHAHHAHAVDQGVGADVHEQAPWRGLGAPLFQRGENAEQLEILQHALGAGLRQQGIGCVPGAALRASDQCLMGIDAALAQIGKGLKNAMQRAIAHQARQRACAMACSGRQLRHHRFPSAALCVLHRLC